jgi:hypothetical protein
MFKKYTTSRTLIALLLGAVLVGQPLLLGKAFAGGATPAFQLDFTAAAPLTYNHDTGGGAFDNRDVGRNKDIVESLEGGDFTCGDLVTYLTQITVDAGVVGNHTLDITYDWTADSTGKSGVAFDQIVSTRINYGVIDGGVGEGLGGTDAGISDNAPLSTNPPQMVQDLSETLFSKGASRSAVIRVNNLSANDKVVLRFDLLLSCDADPSTSPTGNLFAQLSKAEVVTSSSLAANGGEQTIPLKHVEDIKCDPSDPKCQPPPK